MQTIDIAAEVTLTNGERDTLSRLREEADAAKQAADREAFITACADEVTATFANQVERQRDHTGSDQLRLVESYLIRHVRLRRQPGQHRFGDEAEVADAIEYLEKELDAGWGPVKNQIRDIVAEILAEARTATRAEEIFELVAAKRAEMSDNIDALHAGVPVLAYGTPVDKIKAHDAPGKVQRRAIAISEALERQIRDIGVDLLRADLLHARPGRAGQVTRYWWSDAVYDIGSDEHTRALAAMQAVAAYGDLIVEVIDRCELTSLQSRDVTGERDGYFARRKARRAAANLSLDMLAAIGTKLHVFAELLDEHDPSFDDGAFHDAALEEATAAAAPVAATATAQ